MRQESVFVGETWELPAQQKDVGRLLECSNSRKVYFQRPDRMSSWSAGCVDDFNTSLWVHFALERNKRSVLGHGCHC